MKGGSLLLAGVLAAAWGAVYLVTRVFVDPPLGTGMTVMVGVALTLILTVGYPSVLRGPRLARPSRPGWLWRPGLVRRAWSSRSSRSVRSGPAIAIVGRSTAMRSGLTTEAARRTAQLLRSPLGGAAVAITDRERVLAFVGPGADHHRAGDRLAADSGASARVLAGARTVVVAGRTEPDCAEPGCPLRTAVVAPLGFGDQVVGTLQVHGTEAEPPPRDLVDAVAGILSLQLELAELDRERKLAVHAKLDALRAQINPHFLFNVLNTIISKARTDPEEARQLLLRLSDFFRYAVRQEGQFAEFGQEYFFVRTYLALEQARYGERLRVRYDIEPQVLTVHVPVLTIQPLVENAVKHGLADKVKGGTVTLKARVDPLARTIAIEVGDDGVGIGSAVLDRITAGLDPGGDRVADPDPTAEGGGTGLRNISERLEALFGERYRFEVRSTVGAGTVVGLRIPFG